MGIINNKIKEAFDEYKRSQSDEALKTLIMDIVDITDNSVRFAWQRSVLNNAINGEFDSMNEPFEFTNEGIYKEDKND